MKYDLDQLQDQDQGHLPSIIDLKVTYYAIWYCLNQSFMYFKWRIEINMTNEGTLLPVLIENQMNMKNEGTLVSILIESNKLFNLKYCLFNPKIW